MNKELEATLEHVLRMPEHWQKQAAKAMLPVIYKWETRISLPQLSDEDFDRQWRAMHGAGLSQRLLRLIRRRQNVKNRLFKFIRVAANLAASERGVLQKLRTRDWRAHGG